MPPMLELEPRLVPADEAAAPDDAVASAEVSPGCSPSPPRQVSVGDLARPLDALEPADVTDVALVDAVAAWQHVIGAAVARQAEVVRELALRMRATRPRGDTYLPEEIASALTTTRRAAEVLIGRAESLGDHPALADALLAGVMDVRKVDVVLDEVATVPAAVRRDVVAAAVERAPLATPPQLRRFVRRAVVAAEPGEASRRAERARAGRRVTLDWASDAMAYVTAFLPAPDAVAVFTAVDAMAGAHATDGDDRTVDQRRADAFTAVFTHMLDTQRVPGGGDLPRRHGRRATVQVTVAASTLLGLDDQPAELGSYGPIPASLARELAQDGTWRRILTDPVTGVAVDVGERTYRPGADLTRHVVARDVTCTFVGCRQPAWRGDLDHVLPFDPARSAVEQTTAENLHALCRRHHQAKTHGGWSVGRDPRTGATWWTSPLGITAVRHTEPVLADPALFDRPHHPLAPRRSDPRHGPDEPTSLDPNRSPSSVDGPPHTDAGPARARSRAPSPPGDDPPF